MRPSPTKKTTVLLWIAQTLLAALFLFAGAMKFVMPVEAMTAQAPVALSGAFIHFIGAAEMLGALGLVLPGLTGVRRELTPMAAAGLVTIMVGAVVISAMGSPASALMPAVVGAIAAAIVRGRRAWLGGRTAAARPTTLLSAR